MRFPAIYRGTGAPGFSPNHSYRLEVVVDARKRVVVLGDKGRPHHLIFPDWAAFWSSWNLDIHFLRSLCS